MIRLRALLLISLLSATTAVAQPLSDDDAQKKLAELESSLLKQMKDPASQARPVDPQSLEAKAVVRERPGTLDTETLEQENAEKAEEISVEVAAKAEAIKKSEADEWIEPVKFDKDKPTGMVPIPETVKPTPTAKPAASKPVVEPITAPKSASIEDPEVRDAIRSVLSEADKPSVAVAKTSAKTEKKVAASTQKIATKIDQETAKVSSTEPAAEEMVAKSALITKVNAAEAELAALKKKVAELGTQLKTTRTDLQKMSQERDEALRRLDLKEALLAEESGPSDVRVFKPSGRGQLADPRPPPVSRSVRNPAPASRAPTRSTGRHEMAKMRTSTALLIEPNPNSQQSGAVRKNEQVVVEHRVQGWLRVRNPDGELGWIPSNTVDFPGPNGDFDRDSSYRNRGFDTDFEALEDKAGQGLQLPTKPIE